jgi:hypothetical protein
MSASGERHDPPTSVGAGSGGSHYNHDNLLNPPYVKGEILGSLS